MEPTHRAIFFNFDSFFIEKSIFLNIAFFFDISKIPKMKAKTKIFFCTVLDNALDNVIQNPSSQPSRLKKP